MRAARVVASHHSVMSLCSAGVNIQPTWNSETSLRNIVCTRQNHLSESIAVESYGDVVGADSVVAQLHPVDP